MLRGLAEVFLSETFDDGDLDSSEDRDCYQKQSQSEIEIDGPRPSGLSPAHIGHVYPRTSHHDDKGVNQSFWDSLSSSPRPNYVSLVGNGKEDRIDETCHKTYYQ